MPFVNCYLDPVRAASYARLAFPGTYHLAFRDLPMLAGPGGGPALDFGCGAGRSTRFLAGLGFRTTGVDASPAMLDRARALDPGGDYRLAPEGDLSGLPGASRDLVLSAFTFDNVPMEAKPALLRHLARILRPGGRMLNLVSTPELYVNEWASFSTRDFPSNGRAGDGDRVWTRMKDVEDDRPVEDILCGPGAYAAFYREAGLRLVGRHLPLGRPEDGQPWIREATTAPWRIDVLEAPSAPPAFADLPARGMAFGVAFGPC